MDWALGWRAGAKAGIERRYAPLTVKMIRLGNFTPRMLLILLHDLVATAAAIVVSFYIRFEEAGLAERWRLLVVVLPAFLVYAGILYTLVRPVPVEMAFYVAAGAAKHRQCGDRARALAAGPRLSAAGAERLRHVLLRQDHHRALLVPADLFPRRARVSPIGISATRGRFVIPRPRMRSPISCSAVRPTPKCCCARSKAERSRKSVRSASCRRRRPTATRRSAACPCSAASRTWNTSSPISARAARRSAGW